MTPFSRAVLLGVLGMSILLPTGIFAADLSRILPDEGVFQLNNLSVESVTSSSGNTGEILATSNVGYSCNRFESFSASRSVIAPCPAMPSIQYRIQVDAATILLLKNRSSAHVSDFAPGDHINVYGALNQKDFTVRAVIVRNLDKPVVVRPVQLSNLQVDSVSQGSDGVFTLEASALSASCFEFRPWMATMVCPDSLYPDRPTRIYQIRVTPATAVYDLYRAPMKAGSVMVGDRINVYGTLSTRGTVEAQILRDLSVPRKSASSLQVFVRDGGVYCIQSLIADDRCGVLTSATVSVYDGQGSLVGTGMTEKYSASFGNLQTGSTYTVIADAPGYGRDKTTVNLLPGLNRVDLSLRTQTLGSAPVIQSLSGPNPVLVGQTETWRVTASGNGTLSYRVDWGESATLNAKGSYAIPTVLSEGVFTHAYQTPGSYTITVTVTDTFGRSTSGTMSVTVLTGISPLPEAPTLSSLSPAQGPVGTSVTLWGSGFATSSLNTVRFGDGVIPNLSSPDGSTLTFVVPLALNPSCYYSTPMCLMMARVVTPGAYLISVETPRGTTRALTFTVVQ